MNMTIAYSSLCVKYIDEILQLALKNPFHAVEWDMNFIPPTISTDRLDTILRIINEDHVSIRYHLPYSFVDIGHPSREIQEFSLATYKMYLDFINQLNGHVAIIHTGCHIDSSLNDCINNIRILAEYAAQKDIIICIENLLYGITTNSRSLLSIISEDNVYLCLDTGHAHVVGKNNCDLIPILWSAKEKIKSAHVYYTEKNYCHYPLDDNTINKSELLDILVQSNCDWLTMELDMFSQQVEQEKIINRFMQTRFP